MINARPLALISPFVPTIRYPLPALILCVLAAILGLAGCATTPYSDFRIIGEESRYSDRTFILSRNNLLSLHTGSGLIRTVEEGFYANPAYLGGRWFLLVENVTSLEDERTVANRLRNINRLNLSVDGEQFSVDSSEQNFSSENQVSPVSLWGDERSHGRAHEFAKETATFQLTEEQFTRLINAERLTVTVVGSAQAIVFESEQIAASFQPNLSNFYQVAKVQKVGSLDY